MADTRGGLPTKTIGTFQDHEVLMGKLRLGTFEKLATDAILAGAGTEAVPVECPTVADQKFLVFWLKSAVTGKTTIGLQVNLNCATDLSLFDTAVEGNVTIATGKNPRNPVGVQANMTFAGADSKVQGQLAGVGSYISMYNGATHGACGPIYGMVSEVNVGGTSFSWGAATPHALFYGCVSGGGAAQRRLWKNVFAVDGEAGAKASKYMIANADATAGGACTGGLQVEVNGTQYWIPLYSI